MTCTDRSKLSCRTLLFLFVLLGTPMAARCDTLEDSARELARKIAAALPSGEKVSCEIRNTSSLAMEQVGRIEEAIKSELQNRCVPGAVGTGAASGVVVTLSENLKSLVWTGEIRQSDTSRVILKSVQQPSDSNVSPSRMPVALQAEQFWKGRDRILDADVVSDADGGTRFLLLFPGTLVMEDGFGVFIRELEVPSSLTTTRDPQGYVEHDGNTVWVVFEPQVCVIALDTFRLIECGTPKSSGRISYVVDVVPGGPRPTGKGREFGMPQGNCGGSDRFFASGRGDYTQSDSIQVFEMKAAGPIAVSNELGLPGPIMALRAISGMPRAIVRNLTTGDYEAYRLSISCGQ